MVHESVVQGRTQSREGANTIMEVLPLAAFWGPCSSFSWSGGTFVKLSSPTGSKNIQVALCLPCLTILYGFFGIQGPSLPILIFELVGVHMLPPLQSLGSVVLWSGQTGLAGAKQSYWVSIQFGKSYGHWRRTSTRGKAYAKVIRSQGLSWLGANNWYH